MLNIKNIGLLLLVGFIVSGCGSDRANNKYSSSGESVLGVTFEDSDGDGISDDDEINIYHTNPNSNDTDGDGLLDGDEIKYDTNATNPDTDGDGLKDGEEINRYGTNATNPDSDGDSLKDGEEVHSYETNATNPDTDGDGLKDNEEINRYGTSAINLDSDEDGLKDGDEINHYETNATNPDTDGDSLKDGEEVHVYKTDAKNADTDNDGLEDGEEINHYETNATNSDTDGDCLLDSFEVLNYKTDAKNSDTDGDKVNDGIEIYSYLVGEINVTCITSPESLSNGFNPYPAIDNIPVSNDVINALDPNNDSDGDGQANSYENNCSEGSPLDKSLLCASAVLTEEGKAMSGLGYAYIPGGFDVDGDGVNETGFWMSRYQARRAIATENNDEIISSSEVIETVGNINQYISKNFSVVNKNVQLLAYSEGELDKTSVLAGSHLLFDEQQAKELKRISSFTPYLALVSLEKHKLITQNGKVLDLNVTLPTHKQYMHVKKLLDADRANDGDGRHIRNGLLGVDPALPLFDYSIVIDEFGSSKKEYLKNLIQLMSVKEGEKSVSVFTFSEDFKAWWEADYGQYKRALNNGASSTQDLGFGIGVTKDAYAVIVRGGEVMDLQLGVSGADTDTGDGATDGVGFRAATPYFK